MRVYERFHVVSPAMHAVCAMGCSQGHAGAGGLIPVSARVVRTFTWRVVFWREYGGNGGEVG